jgi:hypothetical protein
MENKTTATEPVKPSKLPEPAAFKWDQTKVDVQVKKLTDYYKGFAEKPGYNPWFFILHKLRPLEFRIAQDERTEELFSALMALECKEPLV